MRSLPADSRWTRPLPDMEARVGPDDRSLLRMLCYGTLRNYWQLQHWIGQLLDRPLKKRDSVINALLAVGLFQLCDTRIPDHAAVSQTVEAARLLRRPKLAGLLNACLRRFQRENLAEARGGSDEALWNHPQWLIDKLRDDWPDDCRRYSGCQQRAGTDVAACQLLDASQPQNTGDDLRS